MSTEQKTPSKHDLNLPNAPELEEVVIGTIMLEGVFIDKIITDFTPALFHSKANRTIAEAIIDLYRENRPVDIVTTMYRLKQMNALDKIGGAGYIASLTSRVTSSHNLEYHIHILKEHALKRKVIAICQSGLAKSLEPENDIFDVYEQISYELDNSVKDILNYEVDNVGSISQSIIQKSIEIAESGIQSGVPCGLKMVDNLTNGWQNSDLIIIAGRPSMGKTACAVSMIMNPALKNNIPVAIFSLEMSKEQLVSRMQSSLSEINVSKIVKKQLNMDEIKAIQRNCTPLDKAPIYIDDTPNISLLELKSKARKLVKENGVRLLVIDYLQLMRSGRNINNREQEIAEISRGLKGLAKELDIPVIALSQLSRGVESRGDKKPMLSDLRESGQIEQDADMVLFCYRPEYYGIDQYEVGNQQFPSNGLFMLLVSKHRNGELGEVPLRFIHEQTKITNHQFTFGSSDYSSTFAPPITQERHQQTIQEENNPF